MQTQFDSAAGAGTAAPPRSTRRRLRAVGESPPDSVIGPLPGADPGLGPRIAPLPLVRRQRRTLNQLPMAPGRGMPPWLLPIAGLFTVFMVGLIWATVL